jgi:hypothetical protein
VAIQMVFSSIMAETLCTLKRFLVLMNELMGLELIRITKFT